MDEREKVLLQNLEKDLKQLAEPLDEIVTSIVSQGYSQFPILIVHTEDLNIADKVIDRYEYDSNFHFSASTLEVLVSKGVILKDRQDSLKDQLRKKPGYVCILLLLPSIMKIIFSPLSPND
jgi:hypothetical protein